jgi:HKD family nuclease
MLNNSTLQEVSLEVFLANTAVNWNAPKLSVNLDTQTVEFDSYNIKIASQKDSETISSTLIEKLKQVTDVAIQLPDADADGEVDVDILNNIQDFLKNLYQSQKFKSLSIEIDDCMQPYVIEFASAALNNAQELNTLRILSNSGQADVEGREEGTHDPAADEALKIFMSALEQHAYLKNLSLISIAVILAKASEEVVGRFIKALFNHPELQTLDLSYNEQFFPWDQLPNEPLSKKLQTLTLENSGLNKDNITLLMFFLHRNRSINTLNISTNLLGDTAWKNFLVYISQERFNCSLENVVFGKLGGELNNDTLSEKGIDSLMTIIQKLGLKAISFESIGNEILPTEMPTYEEVENEVQKNEALKDYFVSSLIKLLQENKTIESITLDVDFLTKKSVEEIIEAIDRNPSLAETQLSIVGDESKILEISDALRRFAEKQQAQRLATIVGKDFKQAFFQAPSEENKEKEEVDEGNQPPAKYAKYH